jgi:flagellar biosynthesis regulator FlaF
MTAIALWLVTLCPWLKAIPWKLVGIVLACAVVFGFGWKLRGWRDDAHELAAVQKARSEERAAYTKRDGDYRAQQDRDSELLRSTAAQRDALKSQNDRIKEAIAGMPLTRTVTKVINENCSCPDTRIAPSVRVCINAALSGDSAAVAACEAERLHGSLQGEPVPSS